MTLSPITVEQRMLLDSLKASLGSIAATLSPRPMHDLYEVYLFGGVVASAHEVGYTVAFETVTGASASGLTLRTAPGHLWSLAHPYTHVALAHGSQEWETHLGVYLRGTSGVEHECDVVAMSKLAAHGARQHTRSPTRQHTWLVIEAKYYLTRLPLAVGRGFMGLSDDLKATTQLVTNIGNDAVRRLLVKHRRPHFRDVMPGSPTEARWRGFVQEFWDAAKHR